MSFNPILRETAHFATKFITFSLSYFSVFKKENYVLGYNPGRFFFFFFITFGKAREEETLCSKWLSSMPGIHLLIYDCVFIHCRGTYLFKSHPCVITNFILAVLEEGFLKQCHNINDHWWKTGGLIRKYTVVFISLIKGH